MNIMALIRSALWNRWKAFAADTFAEAVLALAVVILSLTGVDPVMQGATAGVARLFPQVDPFVVMLFGLPALISMLAIVAIGLKRLGRSSATSAGTLENRSRTRRADFQVSPRHSASDWVSVSETPGNPRDWCGSCFEAYLLMLPTNASASSIQSRRWPT